jgi:chromosome segregation ATPase
MKKKISKAKMFLAGAAFTMVGLLIADNASAQTSAKDGLNKISTNLDNTKANLSEYKENLGIVQDNMAEVAKAKSRVLEQQKSVNAQIDSNNKSLAKIAGEEKQLNQLIADEKNKSALEDKKIQELEAVIAKLHDNQKKREANVSDYQLQLNQIQEEKKLWQSRAQTLKDQSQDVAQKMKSVNSDEALWKNKQKGYQGEISRWSKEVDRQQKIYDSYSALAQGR